MLQKRIDKGSIPIGLFRVAQDTKKGTAVIKKYNGSTKKFELVKPSTEEEALAFDGFVTLDIESNEHKESYYDTVKKGSLAVMYTRNPYNEWGTTEFDGELAVGDTACISHEGDKAGKVVKQTDVSKATLEVVSVTPAMGGYEEAMVNVRILP